MQELTRLATLVENIARSREEKLTRAKAITHEAWDLGKPGTIDERRDYAGGISASEIIRQQELLCRNAGVDSIEAYKIKRAGLCEQAIRILEELVSQSKPPDVLLELLNAHYLRGIALRANDRGSLEAVHAFNKAVDSFDKIPKAERTEGSWGQVLHASFMRCTIYNDSNCDAMQTAHFFDKHVQLLSESPKAGTPENLSGIANALWFKACAVMNPPSSEHFGWALSFAEQNGHLPDELATPDVKKAFLEAARAFETAIYAKFREVEGGKKKNDSGISDSFQSMLRSYLMAGEPGLAEEARQRVAAEWDRIEAKRK